MTWLREIVYLCVSLKKESNGLQFHGNREEMADLVG